MILSSAFKNARTEPPGNMQPPADDGGRLWAGRVHTRSKQDVSPELAKRVAVVYRCASTISDDIAHMPLQQFVRTKAGAEHVPPNALMHNMAYLLEVQPNRWMTPFILKKTCIEWLLFWGNALIWMPPPPAPRELYILPANVTVPKQDPGGDIWYEVHFQSGERRFIPAVEVLHVMINSTNGIWGRSVLEYAKDTIGRRAAQSVTQDNIQANGLTPNAYIQVNATLDKPAREKYRDAYSEAIAGAENAGQLAVFDNKITKFEAISINPKDAEFLASMEATDGDICNFFKFPEYKLNMGKQSYESNDQQDEDYLKSTLDPFLVQWEQAARLRWLPEADQPTNYYKFIREAILRMNAKARADLYEVRIRTGTMTPNEAREAEDMNQYSDGDQFWMLNNNLPVSAQGQQPQPAQQGA